jgi:hypothetical protein
VPTIPLHDFTTARVVCTPCGGAIELPIADLRLVATARCPQCGRDLYTEYGPESPFAQLSRAVETVKAAGRRVRVELVVPPGK